MCPAAPDSSSTGIYHELQRGFGGRSSVYSAAGPDKLEATITLVDPRAYTEPWTVVRTYSRKAGEQILECICEENNRNPVQPDGATGFIGPK